MWSFAVYYFFVSGKALKKILWADLRALHTGFIFCMHGMYLSLRRYECWRFSFYYKAKILLLLLFKIYYYFKKILLLFKRYYFKMYSQNFSYWWKKVKTEEIWEFIFMFKHTVQLYFWGIMQSALSWLSY